MPLIKNKDGDLAFTVDGKEIVAWAHQPLTIGFVSAMMNYVYAQGVADGAEVLAQMKQVIRNAPPHN